MDKLIEAINIRKHYNSIPFDEFIEEYEQWSGTKVSDEDCETWKFMGLNNVDFLLNKM